MDMTPPGRHRFMVARQSPAPRRGASASPRPSPNRLNPKTVTKIATPGKVATHQAEARNCRPSTIMLPQLGSGGWAPSPRYDRPDSMRMVWPRRRVACTMMTGSALTSTWRPRIRRWLAPSARGIDESTRPEAETLSANDARDLRPGHEPDDGRGVREPGPEERDDHQNEEQGGNGHEHVRDTHDRRVHRAAEIGRDTPEHGSHDHGETRGEQPDLERDSAAPDHPRQDVAAEAGGAEPVGGARLLEPGEQRLGGVAVGSDCRRQRSHGEDEGDHQPAHEPPLTPPQTIECLHGPFTGTRCADR